MCSEADKRMFKALIMVLETGRFDLTGKEALAFNQVYNWVKKLEEKNTKGERKVKEDK